MSLALAISALVFFAKAHALVVVWKRTPDREVWTCLCRYPLHADATLVHKVDQI